MTATILDFAEPLLMSQLTRSLADYPCGYCRKRYAEHDEDGLFTCRVALEEMRAETRPCDEPPVPWRVTEGRRAVCSVLEATGRYAEHEADMAAVEILTALVRAGVVPGSVR